MLPALVQRIDTADSALSWRADNLVKEGTASNSALLSIFQFKRTTQFLCKSVI